MNEAEKQITLSLLIRLSKRIKGLEEAVLAMQRQLDRIEARVNELHDAGAPRASGGPPLSAKEVAARIGRSPDFVRAHREELGVISHGESGPGRRPRLLFDADAVQRFCTVDPEASPARKGGST